MKFKMKFKPRFNTMFHKLLISYTVLTIIVTIVLGASSNIYFSTNYKRELDRINHRMLEQLKHSIDSKIIHTVEKLGFDVTTPQLKNEDLLFFFKNYVAGNHSKLNNASIYLKEVANYNTDLVSSIHVYYKDNDMMISSSLGVKYLNTSDRSSYKELDFFKILDKANGQYNLWLPTRSLPANFDIPLGKEHIISYLVRYPMTNKFEEQKGFAAINFNENTLSRIIESFIPPEENNLFIIDNSGRIISHKDKSMLYKELKGESYINRILDNKKGYGSLTANIGKDKSIVSYIPLTTGWHIVNITSVTSFYSQASVIQNMLIAMCIIAIFVGLVLTSFFTAQMYNPLKTLTTSIKAIFGETSLQGHDNEYALINNVINDLSYKVTRMESTLRDNHPLIKHSFVNALINNKIFNNEALLERLKVLGIPLNHSYFSTVLIEIDEGVMKNISHENIQFIKFDLIKMIEASGNDTTVFIGAEITDFRLAALVATNVENLESMVVKFCHNTADYVYQNYMINVGVSFGDTVSNLLDIYKSFKKSELLLKYRFFLPERILFIGNDLLQRESSRSVIPDSLLDNLSKNLNIRNISAVEESLDKFIVCFTEGLYSADNCKLQISNIMHIFSNYAKSMDYSMGDDRKNNDLYNAFGNVDNIIKFKEWFISYVKDVFAFIDNKNNNKNFEVIERVQNYICQHLSQDLSLDTVAGKVHLSPRYLSKIFKDETNINFTDYVTQKRMEKAKYLIISTSKLVEQVGLEVGYNNPAYFIRKFKETYGDTPGNFKKNCT